MTCAPSGATNKDLAAETPAGSLLVELMRGCERY